MNDYVAYAVSGWMSSMGDADCAPVYPGQNYPFYIAGIYAAFGTVSALLHALRTGDGQRVTVSVLDAAISIDFYESTGFSYGIPIRRRNGQRVSGVAASI
jgi:crotonobetainyl-CoA:carnitine CoA-transferase CaiB-like acyl-CoA transferase